MDRQAILMAIKQLVAGDQLLTSIFSKYISKENCSKEECQAIINKLSDLLCNEKYTVKTAELFAPLLLELLTLASQFPANNFCDCYARHEWLSICMSKLIWNYPTVSRFAKLYFKDHYNLFWRYEKVADPPAKKPKTAGSIPAPYQLLKAAYLFLIYDTPFFKELWSWTMIVPFLKNGDVRARWYAHQCLGRVGNIKDSDLSLILEDNFTVEEFALCAKEGIELATLWNHKLYNPLPNELYKDFDMGLTCDLTSQTVNIQGILLDRLDGHGNESVSTSRMVCVASIAENLYNIALAITSSEPILLKGPVGCGKTSLVEHLAEVTGRCPSKEFYKVQLGDHIDSKMLLGTHCCTEVPGQFVWQPGVLIKAMEDGNWLLLEDIDCAPMDVISLLVPVLQSRSIVLPGHANPVKASPGFQLFATQRLLTGMDGQYVEFKHNAELIEKQWRKITINPLTEAELTQVITTKWPALHVIIPRILEVYSLFSADLRITSETSTTQNQESFSVDLRHGRLTSMRDLFKFCGRIAVGFDCTKDETGVNVFKTALECFCDHIPNAETRLAAAEAIAVYFNITKKTAKHYMETYKPNIEDSDPVVIGRVFVSKKPKEISFERAQKSVFAHSRQAVGLLEKVAVSVVNKEPVLLVGETGTGKTSIVQYLSELTNQKLVVINMSQQSDSVDLLGGYKPVDFSYAVQPIKEDFLKMFPLVMDAVKNAKFLQHIYNCFAKKRFEELFKIMLHAQKNIVKLLHSKLNKPDCPCDTKAKADQWIALGQKIECMQKQLNQSKTALAFKFIEGALIKAMRSGEWLLLDEINLAEAETLECLAGVLENDDNALLLLEKGDNEPVKRHPDFHIFACMNPATDVGKKDLPAGIRSRFTEFFVEEVTNKSDLSVLVDAYLRSLAVNVSIIEKVVSFYSSIKISAAKELNDGTGHRPHYSLRTLCRALKYASTNPCHNVPRSLYEGFCLSFLSQLDQKSHAVVTKAITDRLLEKKKHSSILNQSIPEPANGNYVRIEGYWILGGGQEQEVPENYVFTDTVRQNLRDLARIVSAARYPVLLQGETSCGKTSLIEYLAKATGNKCVRVNNHEHTDIQEYVGTYSADERGKLSFKEGVLVEAMRNGHWIILDELNLAPTEVMEALNRVLDDNRELFIAETQTIVKADPGFMIFATQNPAGQYGGRKVLSRAFRNRFIELHFNEIPPPELEIILSKRCSLAPSQSKKLVAVMQELQMRRKESGVFAGKQGFITLRDLFRWGERYQQFTQESEFYDWDQHLAEEGYLLLAGRVRHNEEAIVIQEVLKKHFKRNVDPDKLFDLHNKTSLVTRHILERCMKTKFRKTKHANIVWTRNLRRLAVLAGKAMDFNEPCLLVGNTGCGKTTICQMFGKVHKRELYSVNCHMHTEAADFLGGLRPVRDAKRRETQLFEWQDGPLIQAMLKGGLFLADEISLADHSVLERLNSVLEPEKKLFLTEKSFDNYTDSEIAAVDGFYFFATMNPGGDYGKKELSPALRNRFTEIWCPSDISEEAVVEIVKHNFNINEHGEMLGRDIAKFMNNYSDWSLTRTAITMRDILTWVEFMNTMIQIGLPPSIAYVHGAFLVFLDSLGSGQSTFANLKELNDIKKDILNFLENQIRKTGGGLDLNTVALCLPEITKVFHKLGIGHLSEHTFGIGPFQIQLGPEDILGNMDYELGSHSTKANAMRILRAMQLPRPILLEGSPGVGKTSLIDAIAKASGHKLVRINLSEQTDVSDLFGADLPVEGAESGEFAWRDGPLLQALKNQHWILLDELNLASQSVLEGLNACLDHRSEIFISELGRTLTFDKFTTRIFGCQNPYTQGGSRKGLPKSFLNRFTQVYVKPMDDADLFFITKQIYSQIPADLIERMLVFNHRMDSDINQSRLFGRQGAPFEFNLRDVFRWCKAILSNQSYNTDFNIGEYVKLIYADRMRTQADKLQVNDLYKDMSARHGESTILERPLELHVFEDSIQLGHASVERISRNTADTSMMAISTKQLPILESVMKCVELNWMPILVGPAGSGKSAIVRLLAELSGHQLHIMSVNSEMDTVELLGGFEQVDLNRKIGFVANDLEPIVQGAILRCIHPSCRDEARGHLTDILDHMYNLSNVRTNATLTTKVSGLKKLIRVLEELEIPETQPVLAKCKTVVENLFAKVNSGNGATGGRFEWVDSILIHAVSQGHWLLIDDANFCSPSVLDRLNSLLEPNGVLTVSEQGVVGNDLRTITPHRDFRIFLTMNPKNGEISRPMRNRGVEIFIEPIGTETVRWKQDLDVAAFAQCKGLVHSTAVSKLFEVHNQLGQNPIADFLSATSLYAQLLQNHKHPEKAFLKVCKRIYGHYGQNDVFERHLPELTKEFSLPLTSLLPTSIDYRHSAIFAAVKKQSAVFTYFLNHLKNFIKMKAKDPNAVASYFPYPTPNLPSSTSVRNRFFCIMRIMMDTCSLKLHKLLDIWLQYTLEYEIKHETPEGLKENLNLCLRLKNELGKQMEDPIVQELLSYVAEIYDIVEIPDVLQSELTIDPRWLPNVYRQILFNMIKSAEEDNEQVEMAAQMVPYKIEKLGNKFNLLLLWKTQEFTMPGTAKSSQCCLMQTDKVLNIVNKKHLSYAAIPLIPDFLQRTAESLMELLRTDKWDCPNTSYWMFRDAMNSYFTCRKICEEKVDNSKIDYQLTSFSVHFYWLAQKIKTLYSSDNVQLAFKGPEVENGEIVEVPIPKQELVLPETVKANFLQMTQSLSNRDVVNLLRLKLIKKLDHPQGFNNADAADIYKKSLELYKVTNLFSHLNSSDISTLKIVLSNLKEWMLCLTKSVHGSVFQSAEIHPQLEHRVNALQLMKEKLQFFGLINTEDNMEPNQNHIQHVNIPNKKLISNIQLLPLLDYFFILYSSDLLHDLHKFEIVPEMLAKIGCEHLCADPNHLANILNCLIRKKRTIDVLSTVTYLGHLRYGFASEGLNFLQYQLSEDGSSAFAPALEWNDNLLLSKQGPILTYMCNSLFDKPSDAPLMCRSPLGGYVEKFQQLESVKVALWTNLERLADPLMSFRPTTSLIIRSWFFKLLNAVAATKNVEYNPDENLKDQVFHLFQESKIHPLCVTDRQADVLALAFKCYAAMESKMKQGVDDQALMWETGKCYIAVGLLTTMLLLPRDSVDPAVKRNLKAEDYDQKHQEILMEKALRDWIYQVTNGQTLEELAAMSSVPYLNGLFHLQQYVSCKVLNLQKKLIVRPNLHGFERLKEILNNFVTQIGSPDTIIEITQGIFTLVSSNVVVKENPAYGCLQRAENLVKNMKSLVGMLIEKFHFYGDLIMPFIAGIEQIMYGLSLARQSALLKEMDQNLQLKGFKSVADFLTQMVSFPFNANSSPLSIACTLLNADNITDLKTLLTMGNVPPLTVGRLVYKLLKSAILEIINEVRGTPQLKENTVRVILRTLTSAFNALWHLWNAQETEIKKKKEAEDSWFVNKVKHHETEISDDEAIKRRMKMDFPSFDNDFGDCITEQPDILAPKEETPLEIPKEDLHLTPDDIFEIWRLHATAMAALSPTELLNSDKNMKWVYNNTKELDITTPYLLRYEVVCEVVKSMPHRLDGKLDSELAAGHLMMCNELQKRPKIDLKTYDIYHDPNPEEVLKIYPILNKLDAHVKELLTEFPEHASLVQILKLTQRVLSFPVTDPLMKFVIGMELILQTNQFWEAMAHKNISLKYENEELTKKIIECRAMELNCWRSGLESVLRKQYKNSSKWWCHIFSIFASLIENPTNKSDYVTALNGLKQFLEDSPICEFSARLSILHTFFQQSKLSESMHSYKKLSQMFFNLYCYYEQFLPDIEKRIEQIRSPIEKEIKNFVKIARWNDINFHAVKSSVEHSHKFVVKQVKAFEDALKIPAKQVFALPSKKDLENDESLQWILEINKEHFLSKDQIVQEAFSTKPGTFLEKVPRFDAKIRKFSRKFSKSLPVINHINTLNEFAGTVMESLQSVISDSGKKMCTRSQDKKQALLLIQKKKQMLSTLFKNLRVIGLSYRQGMIYAKNKNENDILIVSAFDPKYLQIVKFDREFGELLSKVSQDTSHYFYKSIAQYSLLYKYMESPSKDLSLDIIHRIQGYSGNLLKYIIDQREELVTASKTVDEMGAFVNMLSALKEEKFTSKIVAIPPQGDISRHEDLLNNLMVQYMTLLNQFGTLMECAPVQIEDIFSALPFKAGVFFLPTKNTSLWNTIMGNIFECSKALKESFNVISASSQTPAKLLTWAKFSRISEDFKRLAILITKTVQAFELQRPRYQSITLKDLYELLKKVTEQSNKVLNYNQFVLQTKVDEVAEEKNDRLVGTVQRLTKEVLLVFQDIMKSASEEVDDEESSVDVYPESLFTVKISQYLTKFVEMLRLEKVLKLMQKTKRIIQHSSKTVEDIRSIDASIRLLANLTPFLNQYFQLVKVSLAANVGMHRTSCKFLSILLEVFNILATKGFCIPAELKEEAEKSGATKFEDIEGGGLGEGEGANDVSDKIESEDQLEDTFKEGQEKKENKEEQSDIKNEEHGIEMSEDFEGKSYNPEGEDENEDKEAESEEEDPDLDKQMGDVDAEDAEKLDEKVWGSDSEDEDEELNEDDDATGGVTDDKSSEMVAKEGQEREMDDRKNKDKGQKQEDSLQDSQTDDYQGEVPDPMIDAPQDEPEVVELPDDMEINDDEKEGNEDNDDTLEINCDPTEQLDSEAEGSDQEAKEEEAMDAENENSENPANKAEEESENEMNSANAAEPASEDENAQEDGNDTKLPTHTPTFEPQAQPAGDQSKSKSKDPVQEEASMDWENGALAPEDQHREGQADAKDAYDQGTGHEGQTSTSSRKPTEDQTQHKPKLKSPSENRTLDDDPNTANIKHRPIADKQSRQKSQGQPEDNDDGEADVYEHVESKEDGTTQAVDIATEAQAAINPVEAKNNGGYDSDDVIELSSDEEVEPPPMRNNVKTQGDTSREDRRQRPGERGENEEEIMEIDDGEIVRTHTVSLGKTTIHTQHDLWSSMTNIRFQEQRYRVEHDLFKHYNAPATSNAIKLWGDYENLVSNLSQELCEQLRLVLEPTKMTKLKGDYRTGKRLNMRKIIPYIASQFRKDKIWLRRTKPSKREYQIMLAVDDSSSMADNHSKQLAFESLAVLGQSLSLLEAGELSVVSFGEQVELLLGFNEQFSTATGARMFQKFTFAQKKTRYLQLLQYAKEAMVQARNANASMSKDTAQLLVIISDGRGINNEGEKAVLEAVRQARDNNIFMVFIIIDNPNNKDSILDITIPIFESDNKVTMKSYIESFPFPFYIILRDISTLPVVLGEALRQWFELVTSAER